MGVLMVLITMACTSLPVEKPPVTPYWALGHMVWEDSVNTQEAAQNLVGLYVEHKLPVGGIIIDSPWSQSYNDFNWNRARYPEPEEMLKSFREQNIKVMLWLTGCVNLTARDVPVDKHTYNAPKNCCLGEIFYNTIVVIEFFNFHDWIF